MQQKILKAGVALASGIGAVNFPQRADFVHAFSETTGEVIFKQVLQRMLNSETGRQILHDKPRVTNESVAPAFEMPEGTFGHAYSKFMTKRHFEADDRPPVLYIQDQEIAFVAARMREVHDFWHVLFNCPTDLNGELALKGVEYVQTGLPMAALSIIGGQYRMTSAQRTRLYTKYIPWSVVAGQQCCDLMCVYYEQHFDQDLEELRRQMGVVQAPFGKLKQNFQSQ